MSTLRQRSEPPCLEPMIHSGGVCMLPEGHRGPHGWDYEKQEFAVETPRMAVRVLRAAGGQWAFLADRIERLQGK